MRTIAYEIIKNSSYVIILPLLAGILSFKKNTAANRILVFHIMVSAVFTVVYAILWHRKQNNLPLLHMYTVIEFIFLSVYYALVFPWKQVKTAMIVLVFLFTGFAVCNTCYLQGIYEFNSYARALEAFILLVYGGLGFYFLLNRPQQESLYRSSFFWINIGYFLYFAASLFLFLVTGYMVLGASIALYAWAIHALVMLFMYILVSIGLWKAT